jgi:hypothetical protein
VRLDATSISFAIAGAGVATQIARDAIARIITNLSVESMNQETSRMKARIERAFGDAKIYHSEKVQALGNVKGFSGFFRLRFA